MTPTHIDYIPMSPLATAVRNSMYPTEHGGGFKKVIAVVAMVAIPFVAPAISASIGLSASIGATMGSAVVGGVMGGVASAATGGDWKKGLLGGAISGGIAGYMSTPSTTNTAAGAGGLSESGALAPVDEFAAIDAQFAGHPGYAGTPTSAEAGMLTPSQGAGMGLSPEGTLDYNSALEGQTQGFTGGPTGTTNATADALGATSYTPEATYTTDGGVEIVDKGRAAGDYVYTDTAGNAVSGTGSQVKAQWRADAAAGNGTGGGAGNGTGGGAGNKPPVDPNASFGDRFKAGLKTAYSPENLGKASLQMAGNALTNALVQSDYSAEQQQLIDQRKAEVARLEAQGAEVDAIKLAEAKKLLRLAMQVDPTYLARQKANAAKNQAARSTNEAVRRAGASGRRAGLSESIRRRGALQGGKYSASAFDSGFQGGLEKKIALQKGGVGMLPTSTALGGYYTNLGSQYDTAEEARDKEREGYNQLFGFATTQPGA